MKIKMFVLFTLSVFLNGSSWAGQRKLVINNPSEKEVFVAQSIDTGDEIITEGYWHVFPMEKTDFDVPGEGLLSVRLNFEHESSSMVPSGIIRCGSPIEKFKSIVKKGAEPKVILYVGEGNLEGYASRKEGKSCQEVGGEMLLGFHETMSCDVNDPNLACPPFSIPYTPPTQSMYVDACNQTNLDAVYFSVKFFENQEWRSQGWWEVQKGNCRTVGPFPSDKSVYVLAMNSSWDPTPREWRPSGATVSGCTNPEEGFFYAERADGTCEAREFTPEDALAPEKALFGKLTDPGFVGTARFDIGP